MILKHEHVNDTQRRVAGPAVLAKEYRKAPPPHRGLQLAIYEVIDAFGGLTTERLVKNLPLSDHYHGENKQQVMGAIHAGRYNGFFVREGVLTRIAPYPFYQERQKIVTKVKKRKHAREMKRHPLTPSLIKQKPKQKPAETVYVQTHELPLWVQGLALLAGGFMMGAGLTVMLMVSLGS